MTRSAPVGVAGEVLGRVADGDQPLLEHAAVKVLDGEGRLVEPGAEVVADPLLAGQLLQQGPVGGDQPQCPVDPLERHPAVAPDQLAEVDRQVRRHRELAVGGQGVDHRLGRHPGRRGVPERERGQPVGVDVLRALLQLGERRDRVAGLGVKRVVDFEQDRAVALHDQRVGRVVLCMGSLPDGVSVVAPRSRSASRYPTGGGRGPQGNLAQSGEVTIPDDR